jgi:2-keto-3-deoxy-L-fuconate dehydrogenase
MTNRLPGKRAVVTGAGQGIGRAVSLAFLAEGAEVWAVDRNAAILGEVAEASRAVNTMVVDVTQTPDVAALADTVGGIDVLVNCAGIVHHGSILDCEPDVWHEVLDVNVTSMYRTISAFLPGMLERGGGSIINFASVISSVSGVPDRFAYGTSKAAVIGLTKSVAADFIGRGIRANAICPGTVDTPSLQDRLAAFDHPSAARRDFIARQPMGRLGNADEIAALAVHLASDESGFTTGAIHIADGGMTL